MLSDNLKVLLASTQSFAIKTQNFHWNVGGSNFPQYHAFFDTMYGDIEGTKDKIAEYIRILGHYTPGSLSRYVELSVIQDQTKIPRAELMFDELLRDNQQVIESLEAAYRLADEHLGLQNFLQDRIDIHEKHGWMIRAIGRKNRS